MPKKTKLKVGDRVNLKDHEDVVGAIVWINEQAEKKYDVHWLECYEHPMIRNGRGSYYYSDLIKNIATTKDTSDDE